MKFIHIEQGGKKSYYINVANIAYVYNNNGRADIYLTALEQPVNTQLPYEEVLKLILNTPNF